MKPTVLIGLGNTLMRDEGIGVVLAQTLAGRPELPPKIEILDLGPGGLRVIHAIRDRRKAVFVDCCFMDEPPGTLRRFEPGDVHSRKVLPRQSLHEGDLLQTLELARALKQCPPEIVLFGIEPEIVEPGDQISSILQARMDWYITSIMTALIDG